MHVCDLVPIVFKLLWSIVFHVANVLLSATNAWFKVGGGDASIITLVPNDDVCNDVVPPAMLFISDCKFGISLIPILIYPKY